MNTTNLILSLILMAITVGNGIYTCKLGIIKQRASIDSAYNNRFNEPQFPAADWKNGAPYRIKEANNGMDFSKR